MKKLKTEFQFENARRITADEVEKGRHAIEKLIGKKRITRGRPPSSELDKYKPISIRLHPKILTWAKKVAKKEGVGYQTIINKFLLKFAA